MPIANRGSPPAKASNVNSTPRPRASPSRFDPSSHLLRRRDARRSVGRNGPHHERGQARVREQDRPTTGVGRRPASGDSRARELARPIGDGAAPGSAARITTSGNSPIFLGISSTSGSTSALAWRSPHPARRPPARAPCARRAVRTCVLQWAGFFFQKLIREIEIEIEMPLGLALHHEEPEDVDADLGEQLVDGDVGRAAFALLHLLTATREHHELVHH